MWVNIAKGQGGCGNPLVGLDFAPTPVSIALNTTDTFTAAWTSGQPNHFEWLVDGQGYYGLTAAHTFGQVGVFTVRLIAWDTTSPTCRDTVFHTLEVLCPANAHFTLSKTIAPAGDTVILTGTGGNGAGTTYTWLLDGAASSFLTVLSGDTAMYVAPDNNGHVVQLLVDDPAYTCEGRFLLYIPADRCDETGRTLQWRFYQHHGLNFDNPPLLNPTYITSAMFAFFAKEGNSTISDINGNLLFYTNGLTLWNAAGQALPGVTLDGGLSSTQAALIVPRPYDPAPGANNNIYYIFTSDQADDLPNPTPNPNYKGVNLYTVDWTNPVAPVVNGPLLLSGNNLMCEKLCAVKSPDCESVWVVAHGFGNNTFHVWGITSQTPTNPAALAVNTYNTGVQAGQFPGPTGPAIGQMKISQDGSKLAFAVFRNLGAGFYVHDFNNTTGAVGAFMHDFNGDWGGYPYGVEFSPNGQYLYGSTVAGQTFQFDLQAQVPTGTVITDLSCVYSLQYGPNGRIFGIRPSGNNIQGGGCQFSDLITINNPNAPVGGGLTVTAPFMQLFDPGLGLPGMVANLYRQPLSITGDVQPCKSSTATYALLGPCMGAVTWTLLSGDATMTQSGIQAHVTFGPTVGAVTLQAVVNLRCGAQVTLTQTVEVQPCCMDYLTNIGTGTPFPYLTSLPANFWVNNPQVYVKGTFTIDDDLQLQYIDFYMAPGALLVIDGPAATVNFHHCSLQAGCDSLWTGIYVTPDDSLLLENNCLLRDAVYGVELRNHSHVGAVNSVFEDNYVSIYALLGGASNVLGFSFTGNTVTGGALLPKYPAAPAAVGAESYSGFDVHNVGYFPIGMPGNANLFQNLNTGIRARAYCTLDVSNSRFLGIFNSTAYITASDGWGIYFFGVNHAASRLFQRGFGKAGQASFESCNRGIYVRTGSADIQNNNMIFIDTLGVEFYSMGTVNTGLVEHNAIGTYHDGIWLSNNQAARNPAVRRNLVYGHASAVTPRGVGIYVSEGGARNANKFLEITDNNVESQLFDEGILIESAQYVRVLEDTVFMPNINVKNGISLQGSQHCRVERNLVMGNQSNYAGAGANLHTAFYVISSATDTIGCNISVFTKRGHWFTGGCNNTKFWGNNIVEHTEGFLLSSQNAVMGKQYDQNTLMHFGNHWWGPFPAAPNGYAAASDPAVLNLAFSEFRVENLYPFLPQPLVTFPGWFTTLTPPSVYECPTNFQQLTEGNNYISDLERQIAEGQSLTPEFTEEILWLSQQGLFEKLKEHPELAQADMEMEGFTEEKAEEPMGQFYELANEVKNMGNGLMDANAIAIQNVQDQLHELTQQWNPNFDAIAGAQWDASKSSLMEQLASLSAQSEAQVAALEGAETSALAELALDNQAISTDKVVEENLRLFNGVYLNGAVKGVDGFSADELDILRYLADQCPLSGGNAVFYARGQRALVEDVQYDDVALCAAVGIQLRQDPTNVVNGMRWAPNPATSTSIAHFPAVAEGCTLEIRDIMGRPVVQVALSEKSTTITVSLPALAEGLYFTSIRNQSGEILFSSKLSISN